MKDVKKAKQEIRIKIQNCLDVCSECRKDKEKECPKCDIQEQIDLHRSELSSFSARSSEEKLKEEIASLKGKLAAEKQKFDTKERAWKHRESYLISEHKAEIARLNKKTKQEADGELLNEIKELKKIARKYEKIIKVMKGLNIEA